MSTEAEKIEAIKHSLDVTKKRLDELNAKESLTKSEDYERDMCIYTLARGKLILGIKL